MHDGLRYCNSCHQWRFNNPDYTKTQRKKKHTAARCRDCIAGGYYNPISKNYKFNQEKITKWLQNGVKPTETVVNLLKKADII